MKWIVFYLEECFSKKKEFSDYKKLKAFLNKFKKKQDEDNCIDYIVFGWIVAEGNEWKIEEKAINKIKEIK